VAIRRSVNGKPLIAGERASLDVEEAVARYQTEGGERTALGAIAAVKRAD
jgi:hypothetical protein